MSRNDRGGDDEGADSRLARLAATDLNLLVPLLMLLEERSVTRAAERVGLSQPAVSHILKRARAMIGDELLVRRGGSTFLTQRAQRMLAPLRQLLDQSASLLGFPAFDPAVDRRTIRISATTSTSYVLGAELIALLARSAPNVTLAFHVQARIGVSDPFDDDHVDIALLSDVVASPHPRARLYNDRWVVVADEANERLAEGVTTAHLSELPHVVFDAGSYRTSPYVAMDGLGLRRTVRVRVNDFLLIPHVVQGSDAIAIVQERVARKLMRYLPIRMHELPLQVAPLGIDVIWNPRLEGDPMRRWMETQMGLAVDNLNIHDS